jgi:ADP-ribosylglycohydrolase
MGTLLDQVYGCLVGWVIGDALGAAVENWHYADIRGEHGKVTDFLPQSARSRDGQPGQITDNPNCGSTSARPSSKRAGALGPISTRGSG